MQYLNLYSLALTVLPKSSSLYYKLLLIFHVLCATYLFVITVVKLPTWAHRIRGRSLLLLIKFLILFFNFLIGKPIALLGRSTIFMGD
jgi:hypothetical protein